MSASRWEMGALACAIALLGCREHPDETSPAVTAAPSTPTVTSSVVLPSPAHHGSLDVGGPRKAGAKPEHRDIVAAYAYLVEQFPSTDDVEPVLRLERLDLILDSSLDHGCEDEPTTPFGGGGKVGRVRLLGKGLQELKWETDIALGDDLRLCLEGDTPEPNCDETALERGNVILSVGHERVRGVIRVEDEHAQVHGHFSADVCFTPASR